MADSADETMARLTARQQQALKAWEDTDADFDVLSFDTIAKRSGLARCDVRRTVRDMARRGYTRFVSGCWTDDGEPAGSGYGLTDRGRTAMFAAMDAAIAKAEGRS